MKLAGAGALVLATLAWLVPFLRPGPGRVRRPRRPLPRSPGHAPQEQPGPEPTPE